MFYEIDNVMQNIASFRLNEKNILHNIVLNLNNVMIDTSIICTCPRS